MSKKYFQLFLSVLSVLFSLHSYSQQGVAINTDGSQPETSALLDVKSTNKGFLLPRMTTAERIAIPNPANGLLVFDTDRGQIFQRDGSFWRGVLNTTHWNYSTTRNFLYNTSDSIGIGTATPDEKVEIVNGNIRMSINSLIDDSYINFYANTSGGGTKYRGLRFFNSPNEWVGSMRHIWSSNNGNQIRFSLSSLSAGDLTIDEEGHVGIGTQFPSSPLSINGFGVSGTTLDISDDTDPIIQLSNTGVEKAFMQVSGNDFRMGTNSSNDLGRVILRNGAINRLIVDADGEVGIGTETISAKLHINSEGSNNSLRIQGDNNPTLSFYQGASSIGSIQAGTSFLSMLAPGKLLRLNNNLFVDDASNRVGVGTTDPDQKLHVVGSAKVSTGKILNNSDENLMPVGYATFNGDGTKNSGTVNLTGGWVANDFTLTCTGVDITNAAIIITARNTRLVSTYYPNGSGGHILSFYNSDGDKFRVPFSVVVYKTN